MNILTTKLNFNALTPSTIPPLLLNTIQFVTAIIIIGIVGANLDATSNDNDDSNDSAAVSHPLTPTPTHITITADSPAQPYAMVVALFTLILSPVLFYLTLSPPQRRRWIIAILLAQVILMILWAAAAIVVGSVSVIGDDGESGGSKVAFGFACIELITFFVGTVMGGVGFCCTGRRNRKDMTLISGHE